MKAYRIELVLTQSGLIVCPLALEVKHLDSASRSD